MDNFLSFAQAVTTLKQGWCHVALHPTQASGAITVRARFAGLRYQPTVLELEVSDGAKLPVSPHDLHKVTPASDCH